MAADLASKSFLARSVSEGDHDGPPIPDNDETFSARPFCASRGHVGATLVSWSPSLTLRARNESQTTIDRYAKNHVALPNSAEFATTR